MTDTIHVMPAQDTIGHEPTEDCVCGPRTTPVELDDGAIGWLLLHHSLDGCEHSSDPK